MENNKLTRFVESCMVGKGYIKEATSQELQESLKRQTTRLTESVNSESGGWWVPISFYNKLNGNNRNYNKKLWENVINNQRDVYAGSSMLLDHPQGDSDGSPRDICGVWLDAKLDPPGRDGIGLVYGLLVPCGRNGEDLKDCLKKGLRIGTSSSGFGQLMSDGVTVDPDTYQIERLADWVLNPSQQTFFSYDEGCNSIEDRSIREAIEEKSNIMNENIIKENTMKDSKIAKLEEKKFRRDMESFLESANSIKDPQERLEEFKEIKSYLEDGACPDLREKIEKKIAEEEKAIKDALQDSVTLKEKFGISSADDLAEKLTRLTEDAKVIESESQQWKSIAEKLQEKYTETKKNLEARPTSEFVEALQDSNAKLNEKITLQNKKAYEVVAKLTETCKSLQKEVEDLKAEKETLNESIGSLQSTSDLAKKADTMNQRSYIELQEAYKASEEKNQELAKVVESQKEAIESYKSRLTEAIASIRESRSDLRKQKRQSSELRESLESAERLLRRKQRIEEAEELDERREAMTPVELYYESLYEQYGREILPFKKRLLECANLVDAKQVFYSKVLQNMRESKSIDEDRIPQSLAITPEQRKEAMNLNCETPDSIDRMPKGWV
jgi:hypothetical protein